MEWITLIQTILGSSAILAVVLLILGFLARSLFGQVLSKDIENYKTKLQSEAQLLRANLEKATIEHQIRFESLHARRAEVIAELYRLIVQAQSDASSLARPFQLAGEPSQSEKYDQANRSGEELNHFFLRNRIYFRPELCNRIDDFIRRLHRALVDFKPVIDALQNDKDHAGSLHNWKKTWDGLTKEVPPIKLGIEHEFRQLLGIEDNST